MLYNINFDIAGVILTLGLLLVFWTRRSYPTIESKTFLALAFANAVGRVALVLSYTKTKTSEMVKPWSKSSGWIASTAEPIKTAMQATMGGTIW